ncbi:hypothetical protein FXO38_01329 [Capsicum annuum]|nr:hypothetical protein FXO38_01329 [Capsicum annuum]
MAASINFNPFNNWFNKPLTPFQPINLLCHFNSLKWEPHQQHSLPFTSISNPFSRKPKISPGGTILLGMRDPTRSDFRHAPEVERILNEDPIFEEEKDNRRRRKLRRVTSGWLSLGKVQ